MHSTVKYSVSSSSDLFSSMHSARRFMPSVAIIYILLMLSAVIVIPTHAAKTITMAANVLKKYHTERFATVYLLWLKLVTPFKYWLIISYVFVYSKLEAGGEETL